MDPIEQFIVAVIAAVAEAIAQQTVPLILAALQSPSTAKQGYSDAALQARLRQAIFNPPASAH